MTDEKIIERIKNILELSMNNPSEEEAKAAALKAQELLAKYHIDMREVEGLDDIEDIDAQYTSVGKGKKWRFTLASIVARNFRCKTFKYGDEVAFYGYKTDVDIAISTYEYLFTVGQKGGRHQAHVVFGQTGTSSGVYNSYVLGFTEGVKEALDSQCTALKLVTPEEVKSAFEDYSKGFGKSTYHVKINANCANYDEVHQARESGKQAGRSAMSARAIESR